MMKLMTKFTILLFHFLVFNACNHSGNSSSNNNYQETKMTLEQQEASNPNQFLTDDETTYRPALFGGNWAIEGNLVNSATIVSYRDAVIEISFYDETGALLGKNDHTINKSFNPGTKTPFKIKLDGYSGTKSIGVTVKSATPN